MSGEGEFTWPDGRKYKGSYKNDKKEGYGEFFWADKRIYKGLWKDGKQNGKGMIYNPITNKWKVGIWKKGIKVQWNDDNDINNN